MDRNELEIGKNYSLKYNDPWTNYDVQDVRVNAITSENQVSQYGIDSLYSEFFVRFNIGLATYVTMMNASPQVYICQIVKSRDPVEIDDSIVIIPKVIIDFKRSESLLLCDNIEISINGLVKYHELVYQRGDYLKKLTANVRNSLKNIPEFGDTPVDVEYTTTEILKTKEEYVKYEDFRKKSFDIQKIINEEQRLKHNRDLRAMMEKSEELQTQIADYKLKNDGLEAAIHSYNTSKENYDNIIEVLQDNLVQLYSILDQSDITLPDGVSHSSYMSLRDTIYNAVFGQQ
ncbi:MAG: hypothetical protein ACOCZ5_02830 [bacterium]